MCATMCLLSINSTCSNANGHSSVLTYIFFLFHQTYFSYFTYVITNRNVDKDGKFRNIRAIVIKNVF